MAASDRGDLPTFGYDYDLARWSTGERDDSGHVVWHERLPENNEWEHIRLVTIDFNPNGDHDYRNFPVPEDRPLDPYGSYDGQEDYFDLDDLVGEALDHYANH